MAKVSICIPAYNQPESIKRLLHSIELQKFSDYEIIVSDDSTTPAVEEVVKGFHGFKNLTYYRNEKSLGSPRNWNKAISMATGAYIKIMHHDDWFSGEDSLGEFVALLDSNPDVSFAFSAADAFDRHGHFKYLHTPNQSQLDTLRKDSRVLFSGNFIGAPSATIFRRDPALKFDECLKWLVDIEFYMRMLRLRSDFAFSADPLVRVTVQSPEQGTAQYQFDRCINLREYFYVYCVIKEGGFDFLKYYRPFIDLIRRTNTRSVGDIIACGQDIIIPGWIRIILFTRAFTAAFFLERVAKEVKRLPRRINNFSHRHIYRRNSYSQCGEDLIVDHIFMWLGIERPGYLDIGAHHPKYLSNTYRLYSRGSSGICIEPDPILFRRIARVRRRDVCLNIGIGTDTRTQGDFYIMTSRTLNTFSKEEAERCQNFGSQRIESIVTIPLVPINEVIRKHCKVMPNFISLDVEGLDFQILKTFDFDQYRPEVFCLETITFTENNTESKMEDMIDFMKARGYFVYADTYLNTIFVDAVAWGNRK